MHGVVLFVFFKPETAYERRISDWSSCVCSSDLRGRLRVRFVADVASRRMGRGDRPRRQRLRGVGAGLYRRRRDPRLGHRAARGGGGGARKSVVEGKSVSVRVDLGGRRIIKKKTDPNQQNKRKPDE